jgi:spore maturation protein CgeB
VVFFEKDTPYYAAHRDLTELPGAELVLYSTWEEVLNRAKKELASADKGMVTSYCPDALAASELVLSQNRCLRVFYDLDTPITLASLHTGKPAAYIGERGLNDFDLVLSYTGGEALSALQNELGARRVAPLYGREAMARMGYCPSGRLFEASGCSLWRRNTPVIQRIGGSQTNHALKLC